MSKGSAGASYVGRDRDYGIRPRRWIEAEPPPPRRQPAAVVTAAKPSVALVAAPQTIAEIVAAISAAQARRCAAQEAGNAPLSRTLKKRLQLLRRRLRVSLDQATAATP